MRGEFQTPREAEATFQDMPAWAVAAVTYIVTPRYRVPQRSTHPRRRAHQAAKVRSSTRYRTLCGTGALFGASSLLHFLAPSASSCSPACTLVVPALGPVPEKAHKCHGVPPQETLVQYNTIPPAMHNDTC